MTLLIWKKSSRIEHLQDDVIANKAAKVVIKVEVEEDTTTLTIEMEVVTKIILKVEATFLGLKTSHTYNVLDAKSMDIIS